MKNHMIWMIIGCVVPMLLIFILPGFGVSNEVAFVIFIVLMFACHFMMLGHHGGGGDENEKHHH
jgi:cell division protein FtsW (lipid II flippase)